MDADACVRTYKSQVEVDLALRSMKTMGLKTRLVHQHLVAWVRAHIFVCMLAYFVEWLMRQAWKKLTLTDEDQAAE